MPLPKKINLVLFFTRGVSLKTWDQVGMFEREVALYRRLQEHGVQVSFVTYGDASDLKYAERIPGIKILCNRWGLPLRWYEKLLPYLHPLPFWQSDVIKTNQANGADVGLRTARLFRKPLIVRCGYMWSRFTAFEQGAESDHFRKVRANEKMVLSATDRVVVTTEPMKRYVIDQYGILKNKVNVIPNYVLTDLFRPNSKGNPIPGRISFVGRLEGEKNLSALIEAVRGLNIELEIIGDGRLREVLEAKGRYEGINVRFLGNRPHTELPEHFNAAEICILPSLYEGHPKTLLEAMACGRPVIGTDVPGIRELISHGETGWLCGTDPESIRAAIRELLAHLELRAQLGSKARKFVVENFSLERIVELELALLPEVVKG